ncbi:MAG: hypothetical protein LBS23_03395 [Holosporaceae bacterium]|jgi:hypothetical protein|nr:hypothetical protein [Holosporaceae bacterium]
MKKIKVSIFSACCLFTVGVVAMSFETLDSGIDARKLIVGGTYSGEMTTKCILRSLHVVSAIKGFDRSSPSSLQMSLQNIASNRNELTDEQKIAFAIYLEFLSYSVPGESKLADGDINVIALANVLSGHFETTADFWKLQLNDS